MKKILILVSLFVGLVITASAQRGTLLPILTQVGALPWNSDTLNTSAGIDSITKVVTVSAGYSALGIQVNITKVSGTVGGKVFLAGSIDGVNYTETDSSGALVDQTTNIVFFTKAASLPYVFYRIQARSSAVGATSTMRYIPRFWYVARKFDR